jgi:hypothetical protein
MRLAADKKGKPVRLELLTAYCRSSDFLAFELLHILLLYCMSFQLLHILLMSSLPFHILRFVTTLRNCNMFHILKGLSSWSILIQSSSVCQQNESPVVKFNLVCSVWIKQHVSTYSSFSLISSRCCTVSVPSFYNFPFTLYADLLMFLIL